MSGFIYEPLDAPEWSEEARQRFRELWTKAMQRVQESHDNEKRFLDVRRVDEEMKWWRSSLNDESTEGD